MRMRATQAAVLMGLATLLEPLPTSAEEPRHLTEVGSCRVRPGTEVCICSFSSVGAEMTFGEAAEMVEVFYRRTPDASSVNLLVSLVKQCSGELPSASVPPRMLHNMTVLAPASK